MFRYVIGREFPQFTVRNGDNCTDIFEYRYFRIYFEISGGDFDISEYIYLEISIIQNISASRSISNLSYAFECIVNSLTYLILSDVRIDLLSPSMVVRSDFAILSHPIRQWMSCDTV